MQNFLVLCAALVVLAGITPANADPTKAPPMKTTQGTFLGIEEGDYAHWKMRLKDGKEASYFILHPDSSVEKILANPKSRIGQKCRVQWKTTTETIPEAGGKIEVEQIVSVEWLSPSK